MNIPQIVREKIQSSLVGTPGVDTSGQQLGQEIASNAEKATAPAWQILEKQQEMKDTAEFNALKLQHGLNVTQAVEDAKVKYANNPELALPVVMNTIGKSMASLSASASNPRVKAMISTGDPYMDRWSLKEIAQWGSGKEYDNLKNAAVDNFNASNARIYSIAGNRAVEEDHLTHYLQHEAGMIANVVRTIESSKHPELAPAFERTGMQGIYKAAIDGRMESSPDLASKIANDPSVFRWFKPDVAKKFQTDTDTAVKNWPEKVLEHKIQLDLVAHPEIMQRVMTGQMHWAELDTMQKKGAFGVNPEAYRWMKDSLIKSHPEVAIPERNAVKDKIIADAFVLSHNDLTKLTTKSDQEGVLMSKSAADLYKFQNEIGDGLARGALSKEEAQHYYSWLAVPLVAKTLEKHDPTFFQKISNGVNSFFHPGMPAKVDAFQSATNIVENYLGRHDMEKNYANKASFYESYFKAADEKLKPGSINPKTNAPYTAEDIAHAVVGESVGDLMDTPFGKKSITGYKNGTPVFETTKEEDEAIAHAKAMREIQSKK